MAPAAHRALWELPVLDVRALVRRIHLAAGLTVGLVLVMSGLTGSLLVFRAELDALLNPELLRVEPGPTRVPLDSVVAAVRAAYPEAAPAFVRMPRSPRETYEVTLTGADPLQVYVDPYRGIILGARRQSETLPNTLFALHTSLLAGETGKRVMGVVALLVPILVATGLVVWWPGLRRGARGVWQALTVARSANWRRINFDLHRAVGFWTAVFLTAASVTGASLVFHEAFLAGLTWVTRSPPRPAPSAHEPLPGVRPLPLEELVGRAEAAFGRGQNTYVTLSASAETPVVVRKKVPGERHPNGSNFVYLHPQTGEILAVAAAAEAPLGTRIYNGLYPIHIGRWSGAEWSRYLHAALGLTPLLLFVTGVAAWWNRQGRRRWRERTPLIRTTARGRSR